MTTKNLNFERVIPLTVIILGGLFIVYTILSQLILPNYLSLPVHNFSPGAPGFYTDKQLCLSNTNIVNKETFVGSSAEKIENSAHSFYSKLDKKRKGGVPILIYHHICEEHEAQRITLDDFRNHLQTLYEQGFRPVGLQEFLTFDFKLQKDQKPFILTFDDGWQEQFSVKRSESDQLIISKDCAVGVMQEFNKKYPDFNLRGVFYISLDKIPFGQKEYVSQKFNYLLDLGFEIGNHTHRHDNLAEIPLEEYDRSIGKFMEEMENEMGFRSLMVQSLAFPYGRIPSEEEKWNYLRNYSLDGKHHHINVFMSCVRRLCPIPGSEEFENLDGILPRIPVTRYTISSLVKRDDVYTVQ